jgi:transcription elongation factor GreA
MLVFMNYKKVSYLCKKQEGTSGLLVFFFKEVEEFIMNKPVYFTKEGLQKLKDDLHILSTVERNKISQQIAEARDKGDLSENAEYDAAKDAQGMLELKISKLQDALANARIIDETQMSTEEVRLFTTVKIKNLKNNAEFTYSLVSENEANLKQGRISVTSPIGTGLLGKKVGEIAQIQVPAGNVEFEVLDIQLMQQ